MLFRDNTRPTVPALLPLMGQPAGLQFAQREKFLLCEDRSPDQLLSFVDPLWCDRWGCAYFEVGSPNQTATTDDAEDCPSCHDPVRDTDLAYVAGDPALLYAGSYQRQERFLRGVLGRPLCRADGPSRYAAGAMSCVRAIGKSISVSATLLM